MRQMLQFLLKGESKSIEIDQFTIKIDKRTHNLSNQIFKKIYNNNSISKRLLLPAVSTEKTFSYGYTIEDCRID